MGSVKARIAATIALGVVSSSLFVAAPASAASTASAPVNVTVVVALTAPQRTSSFIDAELLANYTSEFGLLTTQLDQLIDRPVAIGIDPSILASIRILGSSAPPSALAWLDRLAGASNETFPLSWADGDLTLPLHAGSDGLLEPETFDFAIDPGLFAPAETDPSPEESDPPTPAATATADPGDETLPPLPSAESLVAWNYTVPSLAWPSPNSVTTTDLALLGDRYGQVVLSSSNVGAKQARQAHTFVAGTDTIVSDDRLTTLFGLAVTAASGDEWNAAMSQLAAATRSVSSTAENPATVLIAVDRGVTLNDGDAGLTISALANTPGVTTQGLSDLLEGRATTARLAEASSDAAVVAVVEQLLTNEARDRVFSRIAADPSLITSQRRLELLSTLSNAWRETPSGWADAVEAYNTASEELRGAVKIVKSSSITLWADRASLPVTVSNELDQAVTVFVTVAPRTPLLKVQDSHVALTIEPHAQRKASVPVQSLSNGTVELDVTISGPLKNRIGDKTHVSISVQAGWETPVTIAAAIVVFAIFILGIIRTIVRRRRARTSEA